MIAIAKLSQYIKCPSDSHSYKERYIYRKIEGWGMLFKNTVNYKIR